MNKPNILYIMCDQFRYDSVAALGNSEVRTPNIDRLVRRGFSFENAYSSCPVCIPARLTIRTGREPFTTGFYMNGAPKIPDDLPTDTQERCGEYLASRMKKLGYRTFGIGKFHSPFVFDEDMGYDVQLNTEEGWAAADEVIKDAYASFIRNKHPEYNHIEQLHGERSNMYYVPQTSPLPAELTVEAFVADKAVEQIQSQKDPWFGFVSFIGPHPPCAPPIPYNRMYDPDKMSTPHASPIEIDHMDIMIPFMAHAVYADQMPPFMIQNLKTRYYGEITYIDACIGKILDALEKRSDCDNTMICFTSDHGDHLGDHHGWQKESFFEASCKVPFLLSWPAKYSGGGRIKELVSLTDLFSIATAAAGECDVRDGHDIIGMLNGENKGRETLFGYYGIPGSPMFKIMLRREKWKYIYLSCGGGQEQLFNIEENPEETVLFNESQRALLEEMREKAIEDCNRPGLSAALDNGKFRSFPPFQMPDMRIKQFNEALGVRDFGVKGL
jgi:choline-sulfatase